MPKSCAGVKDPIFSSSVAAVRRKPLRAVLLEIAQAYANNLAPKEEKMTAESLKVLVPKLQQKLCGASLRT